MQINNNVSHLLILGLQIRNKSHQRREVRAIYQNFSKIQISSPFARSSGRKKKIRR